MALCAPQDLVQLLRENRVEAEGGPAFSYDFSADNGIEVSVQGQAGSVGQSVMAGSYK